MAYATRMAGPKRLQATVPEAQLSLFTGFAVRIEIFEGPLDLLLYLVRREEVDIAEVSVGQITDQYLSYLRTMEELNIQLAAEFVVLAATLMLIKSRRLLPVNPAGDAEEEEGELATDSETELRRRLQEYKAFREAAELLEESRRERQRIFLRASDEAEIGSGFIALQDVSVFDMIAAVNEMLQRAKPAPPARVRRPEVTVTERIEEVLVELAQARRPLHFSELVALPATRLFVIVTFLAILELIRNRQVVVRQAAPMKDFVVELAPSGEAPLA